MIRPSIFAAALVTACAAAGLLAARAGRVAARWAIGSAIEIAWSRR